MRPLVRKKKWRNLTRRAWMNFMSAEQDKETALKIHTEHTSGNAQGLYTEAARKHLKARALFEEAERKKPILALIKEKLELRKLTKSGKH